VAKIFAWIKANKAKSCIIIVALFLLPLIIVHVLYKWQTTCLFLQSSWDSGSLITYIAGFETFIGTIFLGAVTVFQSEKESDFNERLLNYEKLRSIYERNPSLLVSAAPSKLMTWEELLKLQIPFFSYKDIFRHRVSKSHCQLYLHKILLTPISSNDIYIKPLDLRLFDTTKRNRDIIYAVRDPIPQLQHIIGKESAIYFIHDTQILKGHPLFEGNMRLLLENCISEHYILNICIALVIRYQNTRVSEIELIIKDYDIRVLEYEDPESSPSL
jgi:hypothetical protein